MLKNRKNKKYSGILNNVTYMLQEAWRVRKSVIALCFSLIIISVLINLSELFIIPIILGKLESAQTIFELLEVIAYFTIILLMLKALHAYLSSNTLFGRIEIRLSIILKLHSKTATTSYPNTEDINIQKKFEKAYNAVAGNSQATEAIWKTITDLGISIIGFIIYLAILYSVDVWVMLFIPVMTVIGYFVNKHANAWAYHHRQDEALYSRQMAYACKKSEDHILGKDIRMFGMHSWINNIYLDALQLYEAFINKKENKILWAKMIDIVLCLARNGIVYFYLISKTIGGYYSVPQFLLYFTAVGGFTTWITGILSGFTVLNQQSLDISNVREYFDIPELFRFEEGEPLKVSIDEQYEIQLKNVSFSYSGSEKEILHDFNLTVHSGEKLAVVGPNGAGKSTLIKLICGYYDPSDGEILLNGITIKKYNRRDYYSLFSAVFQQFSVLEASIEENVAQSAQFIDKNKVEKSIEKSDLTNKISELSKGMQTHIGKVVYDDGIELSGGELQRLMLARALYKDAPVIVLDEPTSALDPIAENQIYLKYNELTNGRTSIYISHRLASTRFCDRIIFIADGKIIEEGTHNYLMELGGEYAELFHIQSKYYKKEVLDNELSCL